MNTLKFAGFIFLCLLIFSQNSYSCSCIGTNFRDKSVEGLRKYYTKESNVIVFTGKVLAVKNVKAKEQISSPTVNADGKTQDESKIIFHKALTVETNKFWLGKPESELTVNTGMNSGDCGISLSEGDEFFFIVRRDEENKLWVNICDYSIFTEFDSQKLSYKFTEIFGEPKASPK